MDREPIFNAPTYRTVTVEEREREREALAAPCTHVCTHRLQCRLWPRVTNSDTIHFKKSKQKTYNISSKHYNRVLNSLK